MKTTSKEDNMQTPVVGEVMVLIPARGGSKSIPRKNIVPVLGKPLIVHTIEHAKACHHVSRIVISTDDAEIADIARSCGGEVPFLRPRDLAADESLDVEYHLHAIKWLSTNENYQADMIVNLRPTSPARCPETIDHAIEMFWAHPEADSLRSVRVAAETPFKMWFINERGFMTPVVTMTGVRESYNLPRQKLPLVYWQDGYVDITRPRTLLEKHSTTGDLILPFLIEEGTVDIDYLEEIKEAEMQLTGKHGTSSILSAKPKRVRHPS
jgi:CMP-N,N'-diacetyllegionaminic acid synthase